ncbi:unnamed protein product [Rotaria sp. Silwood1]|nr:unnamed protein product [Rotaria sp. Silwood1]
MNEDDHDIIIGEEEDPDVLVPDEALRMPPEDKSIKKLKKGVFNKEWLNLIEYQPFLKEYKPDPSQATCIVCNQQFSLYYRGKSDIDNHMKTKKHQNNMKSFDVNRQLITKTIKPSKEKDEVAAAEGVLVYHGVKHGHSYLAQQCTTNVCKAIFSSSSIANNLSSARTKSTCIALNVLAPCFTYTLLDDLKQSYYYSLMYDASNKGNMKVYPFCVQFLSTTGVKKGIIDLIDDAEETALKIFSNARKLIIDNDLDINGLSALGADNTNVNVGENHSVFSLFNDEFPDLIKERLVHVWLPIKKYFLEQHDNCPLELKKFFELDEATCILSFLQHVLFELHKKNLELQRNYTTAVDLFRIITSIKTKLQERIDSEFFGAACRYKLMRLPIDTQNRLKSSFIKFLSAIIAYIDSYFDKNITFYQTISYFGQENIEGLTWHQVIQCVEMIKLKSLDEDRLFDEFTNVKSVFKTLLDQPVSLFDQVQAFIRKQNDISKINNCVDEKEDDDDDHLTTNKIVRSDQLWMFLFSITESPNFKKLICFLYSLPCSNAFVESVFSQMKHLLNDRRKRMTNELVSAELKIRFNSTLSCTEMYKYILCNQDLLKAIKSDEKYTFKKKRIQ